MHELSREAPRFTAPGIAEQTLSYPFGTITHTMTLHNPRSPPLPGAPYQIGADR